MEIIPQFFLEWSFSENLYPKNKVNLSILDQTRAYTPIFNIFTLWH